MPLKATLPSKTAIQKQEVEPVKNHEEKLVADVAKEETPVEKNNSLATMKSESPELPDLPDCIISHIFSKLSFKSLVKTTSLLSKQWFHEWELRKDLNFDLHNMFDYTKSRLPFQHLQSQFATGLEFFSHKYHGDSINSIRVNFPLGHDHTYAIDGLIHKGLVKGANRIELLFAHKNKFKFNIQPYIFSLPFLSCPNSLTYLHLQKCHIGATMQFSGLKSLTTLVLHLVPVEQNMLKNLCFNCIHLENFTLNECLFLDEFKITSTSLLHLNINCGFIDSTPMCLYIFASNLLSFEYSTEYMFFPLQQLKINCPMLSNFYFRCGTIYSTVEFSNLKNVTTIVLHGLLEGDLVSDLVSICLQLENLTLHRCKFTYGFKIISAKLRHLSIIYCHHQDGISYKLDIQALHLSSFEFIGYGKLQMRSVISLEVPMLLKVFWDAGFNKINVYDCATVARLHQVENLPMHTSLSQVENLPMPTSLSQVENLPMHTSLSQISKLTKDLVQSQNVRQLELFIAGAYNPNIHYFWILDIAMPSQHLQKLSLTITN